MGHCKAIVGFFFFFISFVHAFLGVAELTVVCNTVSENLKIGKGHFTRASTFDWRFNYYHLNFNSRDKSRREKPSFFFHGRVNGFSWQIYYILENRFPQTR